MENMKTYLSNIDNYKNLGMEALPYLWKILIALAMWIIGRKIIHFIANIINKGMVVKKFDDTLARYLVSAIKISLTILLALAILGTVGVETTSFSAILAAVGLAVGMAWSGLLANFAAGVFLIVLKPFKVGDVVSVAGAVGEITEVGMFSSTLKTVDNLKVVVGNNKIFSDNITNYSSFPNRRVDLTMQVSFGSDVDRVMEVLKTELSKVKNLTQDPDVEILIFNERGTQLAIRPYTNTINYWQVYFDTTKIINKVAKELNLNPPHTVVVDLSKK